MVLVCMTCTATSGSGQPTGGDVHFHRPVPNRTVLRPVPPASFVVAAGAASRTILRRRTATTSARRSATTASGFVWFYPSNQRLLGRNSCGGFSPVGTHHQPQYSQMDSICNCMVTTSQHPVVPMAQKKLVNCCPMTTVSTICQEIFGNGLKIGTKHTLRGPSQTQRETPVIPTELSEVATGTIPRSVCEPQNVAATCPQHASTSSGFV